MSEPLPDGVQEALDTLLPTNEQSGDTTSDLVEAAKASMRRREENTRLGGLVITALHDRVKSWRRVESLTGIPFATARRWAEPPADDERGEQADGTE